MIITRILVPTSLRRATQDSRRLGVNVEDLLIVETGKAANRKAAKSNGRPAGKVREVFDRVSKLPRRQQEHIVNWVSAYVSQYEQTSRANHS
jgi:hypothetical protein